MKVQTHREMIHLRGYAGFDEGRPLLVAHKGGVIAPVAPENSLAAIRLAALHGYDMVEIDVQEARDHEPVVFHDADLFRDCGIRQAVRDLTSAEVTTIRPRASTEHIATLAQSLALCAALKLGVMLDLKIPDALPPSEAFLRRIGDLLAGHGLASASVTISQHPLVRQCLADVLLFPVSEADAERVGRGEPVSLREQYWFGLPEELPSEWVKRLQDQGAFVLPALNGFRYPAHAHLELARRDAERLLAAGVDGFQIDSMYEGFFISRAY